MVDLRPAESIGRLDSPRLAPRCSCSPLEQLAHPPCEGRVRSNHPTATASLIADRRGSNRIRLAPFAGHGRRRDSSSADRNDWHSAVHRQEASIPCNGMHGMRQQPGVHCTAALAGWLVERREKSSGWSHRILLPVCSAPRADRRGTGAAQRHLPHEETDSADALDSRTAGQKKMQLLLQQEKQTQKSPWLLSTPCPLNSLFSMFNVPL